MRILITAILFLLFTAPIMAQGPSLPSVSKKAQKFFDDAQDPLNFDRFDDAEKLLLKAVEAEPKFVRAWESLGYLYIRTKQFEKSYQALQQVVTISPDYSREIWYHLAKDALAAQKFDSVEIFVAQYRKVGRFNEKREAELKALEANLQFAKQAVKSPVPFNPVCLDTVINSRGREYYPMVTADGEYLFFTRQPFVNGAQRPKEDIMVSKNLNGKWSEPQGVAPNINLPSQNNAAHSISPDGKTLYYTICNKPGGFGSCDVYYSTKVGNTWSDPVNMGAVINTTSTETQPCISGDGKTLYFVSDRAGGFGKLDIWQSNMQVDGTWGKPTNMGSNINSVGVDEDPFIHVDGETFYFSSDGRPGFGDDDIYYTHRQPDGTWRKAENMGSPINSTSKEWGLFITRDGSTAYYSTDRFSKDGNWDICTFSVPAAAKPNPVTFVKGSVRDSKTNKAIATVLEFIDVKTGAVINRKESSSFDGSYLVTLPYGREYALNILQKGYLFYSEHFSLTEIKAGDTYTKDVFLAPITTGSSVVLNNIFFESKSFELKRESETELSKLIQFLRNNPTVKMEISGHTDNVGQAAANLELSNNRAKTVMDYLVKAGIDKTRLTSKGYGETKPMGTNETDEGRAKNRRTEFKVTAQ